MQQSVRTIQIEFVLCPFCFIETQVGALRCPGTEGHWLWWNGTEPTPRTKRITWPRNGKIVFRNQQSLHSILPGGAEGTFFHPGQRVKIVNATEWGYELEDGSWLPHQNVVVLLHIKKDDDSNLGYINDDGNGAYSYAYPAHGAPEVNLLLTGTKVKIIGHTDDWYQIGLDEWVWKGFVTLQISVD